MIRLIVLLSALFISNITIAEIPIASDLQDLYKHSGTNTEGNKKVVLILVSQPGCSFCAQIDEEIISPMIISGHYLSTTLFVELRTQAGKTLKDFSGDSVTAEKFAKRYNAWATPTLLFLDGHGNSVAENIIGINTPELFGYYVDKAINEGLQAINH